MNNYTIECPECKGSKYTIFDKTIGRIVSSTGEAKGADLCDNCWDNPEQGRELSKEGRELLSFLQTYLLSHKLDKN